MLTEASLASSASTLILNAALAGWFAFCLLRLADRRLATARWELLLAAIVVVSLVHESWELLPGARRYVCFFVAAAVSMRAVWSFGTWLTSSPKDVHAEISRVDPQRKKSKRNATQRDSSARKAVSSKSTGTKSGLLEWCFAGGILVLLGYLLIGNIQTSNASRTAWYVAATHAVTASAMWGTALLTAIELTFLASPDSLNPEKGKRVEWSRIAWAALILFVVSLGLCVTLFMSTGPGAKSGDPALQALPMIFAVTLLTLSMIAWMVPHRIHQFQKDRTSAKGWTSLTLASWLAFLAFGIVCALPYGWPWAGLEF